MIVSSGRVHFMPIQVAGSISKLKTNINKSHLLQREYLYVPPEPRFSLSMVEKSRKCYISSPLMELQSSLGNELSNFELFI